MRALGFLRASLLLTAMFPHQDRLLSPSPQSGNTLFPKLLLAVVFYYDDSKVADTVTLPTVKKTADQNRLKVPPRRRMKQKAGTWSPGTFR